MGRFSSLLKDAGTTGVGWILLALMGLTVADVFCRFVLRSPIYGASEYSELLMVLGGFLGIAWCGYTGRHIQVEIFVSRLPIGVQRYIDFGNLAGALFVSGIIAWASVAKGTSVMRMGIQSFQTEIKLYPFYYYVGLCYFLLLIVVVVRIRELFGGGKGDES